MRIIELATRAVIEVDPETRKPDPQVLPFVQKHVFDLGDCPQKGVALFELLTGSDTPLGRKGLLEGHALAGVYGQWDKILSAEEPRLYVRATVNAKTARGYARHDSRREPTMVTGEDALSRACAIQETALLHGPDERDLWNPRIGSAFEVADRVLNGFAADRKRRGMFGSGEEPAPAIALADYNAIYAELNRGTKRDKRIAKLLAEAYQRKLTSNGADADYQFLRRELRNPDSRLNQLVIEVLTQKARETCSPRIICESAGLFLDSPHPHSACSGRLYRFPTIKDAGHAGEKTKK